MTTARLRRPRSTRLVRALALGALALGALAGLAAPAASQAATLSRSAGGGSDYVRYVAAPGEANQLDVRPGPAGTIAFVDPEQPSPSRPLRLRLRPRGPLRRREGPRPRRLAGRRQRQPHGRRRQAGPLLRRRPQRHPDRRPWRRGRWGGAGNDVLDGRGGTGNDVLDGRGGADVRADQDGVDTVSYATRTARVTVDLATATLGHEGEASEHDTVASDLERVTGSSGNDTLTGNAAANLLDGRAGNDVITGGGADDLRGGPGGDTLHARDGVVDRVDCGTDADTVDADATDWVSGCESAAPAPVIAPTAPPTLAFRFGDLELPRQPVVLHRGHVTLTIACPADTPSGRCSGVISFERFVPHGKTATAHSSRRTRRFRIADQAYSVKAGRQARLRVRISSVGRRAVRRAGSLKVKVYVRRTRRATKATRVGTLRVHASRRTKRRPGKVAT